MVTWRWREDCNAFPPLSSPNQHRTRARCPENKQEQLEKLMRDETGTVCLCPCYGAGALERGPGSRAFRLPCFSRLFFGLFVCFTIILLYSTFFNLPVPRYFIFNCCCCSQFLFALILFSYCCCCSYIIILFYPRYHRRGDR